MTGFDHAGHIWRGLARFYDWVVFTIVWGALLVEFEFIAIDTMLRVGGWFNPELHFFGAGWGMEVPHSPFFDPDHELWVLTRLAAITPMVMAFLYEIPLVALCGQTVGKMLTRVQVVRFDNRQLPGWGRSARRWLVLYGPMLIPIIGWFITLLIYFVSSKRDPNGRALHDRIAGTIVIASTADTPSGIRSVNGDSGGEGSGQGPHYGETG